MSDSTNPGSLGAAFLQRWLDWNEKLLLAIIPLVILAIIIHFLEKLIQNRLASRFGWSSILATGWIGTPIHEFSHVVMCWIFNHRIDAVALFKPDRKSGRLGYVQHSCKRNNWYQQVGNVFIAIAPLIGGSICLLITLWIFYPAIAQSLNSIPFFIHGGEGLQSQLNLFSRQLSDSVQHMSLTSPRFWLFAYLVLCIGSHMAPSRSDYAGAGWGSVFLLGAVIAFSVGASMFPSFATASSEFVVSAAVPLWCLFAIATALTAAVCAVVWLTTVIWDMFFRS
jgi:hypothetical protein